MSDHELTRHSLSRAAFREICAGAVSRETMVGLLDAEYSRRRLLLRAVADTATTVPVPGSLADPMPAWDVLARAEVLAPGVVRDLILHPPFGVWLHRVVARTSGAGQWDDVGYLNTIAAAVAIRADVPCDLALPVSYGVVVLPTVGRLRLPTRFPAGMARLRHSIGETVVTALGGRLRMTVDPMRVDVEGVFRAAPSHSVTARGVELSVWLDDTDPYREFREPQPPHEASPTEMLEWRKLLDEVWELLTHHHPAWAREIAAGIRLVSPVVRGHATAGFSSAGAIGAVAAPAGLGVSAMAETFVHELQHSKMNALSRLVSLTDADAPGWYYAPWRGDPRPLTGMLHGVFAFVAVAEFWLASRREGAPTAAAAEFWLAYYRRQVGWALDSLASATGLTDAGIELVADVRRRLAACLRADVATEVDAVADRLVVDHYAGWRMRNIEPDHDSVVALADDWRHGRPARSPRPGRFRERPYSSRDRPDRQELLRARVLDPVGFTAAVRGAEQSGEPSFRADAAYARDDHDAALAGYLAARAEARDTVIGVGLCLRGMGRPRAARVLLTRPELVAAIWARIGTDVDPIAVAAWLDPAVDGVRVGTP